MAYAAIYGQELPILFFTVAIAENRLRSIVGDELFSAWHDLFHRQKRFQATYYPNAISIESIMTNYIPEFHQL